jgi:hypothetical protein
MNQTKSRVSDLFPTRTAVRVPADTLQRYTGRYQFGLGRGVGTVALVDGQLSLQLGAYDAVGLQPESRSMFFFPSDRRVQLRFDSTSDGKLEAVYLVNGEQAFRGPKLNP